MVTVRNIIVDDVPANSKSTAELKVEAMPAGVRSCCLYHFVKSGAICPSDTNLIQFQIGFSCMNVI